MTSMTKYMRKVTRKENHGFTLAEVLIVVAIIGVLVAISIPMFAEQLEKSRESVDFANVRSAYAEVMMAVSVEDTTSKLYKDDGSYRKKVRLKQRIDDWSTKMDNIVIGGVAYLDKDQENAQWLNSPKSKGICEVYYKDHKIYFNWQARPDYINKETAAEFLKNDILMEKILKKEGYGYSVINSNETDPAGATKKFLEYAAQEGFDLKEYDAATWQIYVKEPTFSSKQEGFLERPAIYWSTLELDQSMYVPENPRYVPVIGYREDSEGNGHYDVFRAKVVEYSDGNTGQKYLSIANNFANVTNEGGSASFQFDSYEDAQNAYNRLLEDFQANGTVTDKAIRDNHLN